MAGRGITISAPKGRNWGFNGDPGSGGYVNPGGSREITLGVEVTLWATYDVNSPPNPRFKVEWGDGSEADATGCGSCKLSHTYAAEGSYTVKASLDDRVSTVVTRTFVLLAGTGTIGPVAGSGTKLVPGNTTAIAERDGYRAQCTQWNGSVCEQMWVSMRQSDVASPNCVDDFTSLRPVWSGDEAFQAPAICWIATGDKAVISVTASGPASGGPLCGWMYSEVGDTPACVDGEGRHYSTVSIPGGVGPMVWSFDDFAFCRGGQFSTYQCNW